MGCGAAEATDLAFVCFVVINPRVLLANRVDFGLFFVSYIFQFTPPPQPNEGVRQEWDDVHHLARRATLTTKIPDFFHLLKEDDESWMEEFL